MSSKVQWRSLPAGVFVTEDGAETDLGHYEQFGYVYVQA